MKYIVVCLAALAVLGLEVCSNEVEVAGDDLPQTDQLKLASFSSRVAEAVIPATSGKRSEDYNVYESCADTPPISGYYWFRGPGGRYYRAYCEHNE
ncbi:hypothetical protein CpipJ_CPIJ011624 [Culex quinquefasciatus]|uniref:Uncharacterized protein n=1 Tax=Culex quinquefasciatus TaxID=7176 RepID=B0WWA9_CULQU|nr:hypothetical protein CpipJ_CPIJ011624 [Culex quinquefasciatus]|eukprot:XP_001861681.1 hypothetical protein CpipJ_CPIJ011624 [Culex quinquefasciatus]